MFRFLLRFFAVFIACSAFVGLASRPVFATSTSEYCESPADTTKNCGTIDNGENTASCNADPLTFESDSHSYGTYTLTAQYVPNQYRITYVTCANGTGGSKSYSGDATYGLVFEHQWTTQTFDGAGFSANAGWHFVGWNTMQDGTGVSYEEGTLQSAWNQTNGLTLYAICEENDRYTVTYKAGTCGKDGLASDIVYTDSVAAGVSYTASQDAQTEMESAQNPVYTFVGWNKNSGQTTSNWSGETISGNVIVYAACTPKDYTVTYKGGTCEEESQITENVDGGASYSVKNLTELSGFSAPSNTIFAGWQVCWESETSSGCANMSPASFNAPKDNSWTFAWKNDANLTLTGICNPSCAGNQDYPRLDSNNKSCYKIETVYCTPVTGTVPDNCLDTEENPAEWSETCTCNGVSSISYRVYENGTIAQEDGGDIPDQVAPTLTCSELLSATGAPGYNDYDPDLKQCPEIDTFELTFNCNDGHTGLDESDRQAGSLITIAQEAPTCYLDVKNWTCEPENSLVEATYSEGAITSFKMPNTNVICTANYEYKVDYYCDEDAMAQNNNFGTGVAGYQESYTWEGPDILENQCSSHSNQEFANKWVCDLGLGQVNAGYTANYNYTQDMKCYALWEDKQYTITYNVVLGDTIYSTKNGVNSSDIIWPVGNPDIYTASTDVTLENPTSSKQRTDSNYVVMPGRWYECDDENKAPVTQIAGSFAQNPRNLNLCIEAGWPITYMACYDPNTCSDTEDVTDFVCDSYNKIYYRPGHAEVTFPTSVSGECSNRIDLAAFDGKWYTKSGNRMFPTSTTQVHSGPLTVYAKLQKKYRVSYDCNTDGLYGPAPVDSTAYSEGATVRTKTGCTRDGYDYKWRCEGVSNDLVPGTGTFSITRNTKCIAQWTEKKYSLKYNCANGTQGVLSDETEYSGTETNVSLWAENNSNPPTKVGSCNVPSGKHFDKWTCDNNVTVNDNNTINMKKADITCTANWLGNDYKVIYNCNDGNTQIGFKSGVDWSLSDGKDKVTFNSTQYTFKVATDTCETQNNKTVTGWSCSASGTPWTGSKTWNIPNDVTCNAIWSNLYSLTYDCGEGTGDPSGGNRNNISANTKLNTLTVSESTCTNPGKEFEWSCDGETIVPGNQITINANRHCTAIWGNKKYTLTYDCANGDAAGDGEERREYRDLISGLETKKNCVVPSDTQEFDYWTCEPVTSLIEPSNGSNNKISSFRMPDEDVTCTAHWKNKKYSVKYNCNGGTVIGGTGETETINDLEYLVTPFAFTKVGEKCERYGHTATKWNCNTSLPLVNSDYTIKPWSRAYNVTCNAVWDTIEYTLTYDCKNEGYTVAGSGRSYEAGTNATIAEYGECGTKNGSKMVGWDCGSVGSTIIMDSDKTCTAIWESDKYSVTYNCNGGTVIGGTGETETINDLEYLVTPFAFTKVGEKCERYGHTATKWNCNTSLSLVNSDYTIKPWSRAYNVTCNAEWKVEEYDLTYDCNNGGKGTEPAGGTYPYGQQDVPVEKGQGSCKSPRGQYFTGWTCDVEVVDYKFTMPRRNVVCRGGWKDSTEDITYVGCVNGTCVVRCNDGNCVSVGSSCEGEVLYLNPEINEDKWTYSNTKVVYFPGVNEDPAQYLLDAGYKFSGKWNKTDGFRTAGEITSTNLQTGSLTMCTILEPYYKVTYNCGWNHQAPVDEKRYDSRETVTVKNGSDCGDRPGYSFTKWVCEPNGKTAFDKNSGQTFQIEANTTCTAQWKEVSYRVTYDCNGKTPKTNNMVDKPIYYGTSYTFSDIDERCLHEGYTFGGWECYKTQTPNDKDYYRCPTGDDCPDSITWDFADNLKCKALWDVDYYDVIYDKGSCADAAGVVYTDEKAAAYGQNYTPSETASGLMNTATKSGYTFVGWNTVSGQTTSNWTGEKPWTRQSNLTVYAACTPNKYDVIYDKGACESKSGKNYTHKNGATYGTKYTALSGGSESSKTGIYAGTGYTFKGWSETQTPEFNDNGTLANPWTGEDPWLFTATKTVYGICKPNTYNVIYMKGTCEAKENTGDGTFTDSVEYNANYTVLGLDAENMTITTKPGYVFKGWKASYASQVPDYQAGYEFAPWTRTSALTLWAVCEKEPYHVEYDCDVDTSCDENDDTGCRTPKDNRDYYINDSVTVPINDANTCKKLGWTFNDWDCVAKDENETSLPITVIGSYAKRFTMINADAICTAKWDEDVYHVTYDCNGGTNAPTDSTGYTYGTDVETYGQNNPQKLNTCEREGYDFTVWVCGEGEEAQTVAQGGIFENITHDTTCYAQWMPRTYDIIYDSGTCGGKMPANNSEYYSITQVLEDALQYDDMFDVDDITDLDNLYVARGYEFLGWSTENGGTTEEDVDDNYSVGEHGPWTTDGDLILYAVCKKKVYNVCYDFQVEHAGWKDKSAEPLYTYDVDTEMNSREVHLAVHKDVSNDLGEGKFYVFDGWYNMPGIYRDQNNSGPEITTVPNMNAEPLDTPVSLRCDGTIVSPQCDDSEYAKCDVVLYAKWLDAGKVRFSCGVHDFIEEKEAVNDYIEAADPEYVGCVLGGCDFVAWHCENYTGMPKDYVPEEDSIQVLVADTTVLCTPVKDCSGLRYDIKYHVYQNGVETSVVNTDAGETAVRNLKPDTYSPGDEPVPYPEVSWPNCRFTGWYENPEFTGETVTHTPALTINEEGEDIDLYGQMICEDVCNEPGHEHWFHIGNNPNDKVCLYEKRPTTLTPAVRVKGKAAEPYYMMLSTDPDMVIHEGSRKSMRIQHENGIIYNVCDKSSCPELAN